MAQLDHFRDDSIISSRKYFRDIESEDADHCHEFREDPETRQRVCVHCGIVDDEYVATVVGLPREFADNEPSRHSKQEPFILPRKLTYIKKNTTKQQYWKRLSVWNSRHMQSRHFRRMLIAYNFARYIATKLPQFNMQFMFRALEYFKVFAKKNTIKNIQLSFLACFITQTRNEDRWVAVDEALRLLDTFGGGVSRGRLIDEIHKCADHSNPAQRIQAHFHQMLRAVQAHPRIEFSDAEVYAAEEKLLPILLESPAKYQSVATALIYWNLRERHLTQELVAEICQVSPITVRNGLKALGLMGRKKKNALSLRSHF